MEIFKLKLQNDFMTNYCYVIYFAYNNSCIIIDPSWELEVIESLLQRLKPSIINILLTHSHFDHVNLVNPLVDKYNAQVYIHIEEVIYSGYNCDNLHLFNENIFRTYDGQQVICFHTPGHTPGSVCYYINDSLFTGDTLFIEGCGKCTSRNNAELMFESLKLLKLNISSQTKIYPGHSYGIEPGQQFEFLLKNNLYLILDKKEHFVKFMLRKKI